MENRQFAEGYRQPASHVRHNYDTPEERQLMEGPRKWASFFDRQLILYLKGTSTDDPADVFKELNSYSQDWVSEHLDDTVNESRELLFNNPYSSSSAVNELNFHILNRGFAPMWRRLLVPEAQDPLNADQIEILQTRLAFQGLSLVIAGNKAAARESKEGLTPIVSKKISGQVSEIDTGIVLLEDLKDDSFKDTPGLVVVPAPPRFGSGYKNSAGAVNFLIIDTNQQQTRGIQTTTYLNRIQGSDTEINPTTELVPHARETKQYDDKYVTLVDGMTDLGNSKMERTFNGERKSAPNPGLISLDFFKFHTSVKKAVRNPVLNQDIGALIRARELAKQLSNSKSSYLFQAKRNIHDRITRDLYK